MFTERIAIADTYPNPRGTSTRRPVVGVIARVTKVEPSVPELPPEDQFKVFAILRRTFPELSDEENENGPPQLEFTVPNFDERRNTLKDNLSQALTQRNKLSIHIETGNIYYDNIDTGESIYSFFMAQQDHTKKLMFEEFQFFDSYEDYIMNYLTQIESEKDDVLDILSHKNTKFLFYQFNQYLGQIGKPLKLIKHTVIADDNYALTVIQEKRLQYFIESLLERSLQTTDDEQAFFADGTPQENAIVNDSIQNITFCKNAYKNLYNAVADCLPQSFNYMDKEHLKKMIQIDD